MRRSETAKFSRSYVPGERVLVPPSMMCADPCNLESELRRLENLDVDWLHFDLMDAHFVPNMPLGLEALRALRT
jgi:ribulose-phosphate 3-epimerase